MELQNNDNGQELIFNNQSAYKSSFLKDLLLFFLDIVINAAVIILIVLAIRQFFIAPFEVYGPSMCNELNYYDNSCKQGAGEYILINKFSYLNIFEYKINKPERGDIVVFKEPVKQEQYYIKRVIGVPGDTVILEDGFVYIKNKNFSNAIKLDEKLYLNDLNFGQTKPFRNDFNTFEVPENSYFVLGDNRNASADSRRNFSDIGPTKTNSAFIPEDLIIGKAWVVIWPLKNIRILQNPDYGDLNVSN
jgi:signal peptidase I